MASVGNQNPTKLIKSNNLKRYCAMETLLEDYKRKLKIAETMLKNKVYNSNEQANRIKIKASVYKSTIVDIERAMAMYSKKQ